MEGIVFDVSALRRDYRDSITQLSNTAVHRKNVDDDIVAESCYICLRGWEIGEEVTTLRCECSSYAHEACLAKSVFETGDCPTCRKSIFLIDDEIILGQAAADGDTEKLRRLLENGIQRSPRGLFDSTPLLQAAQNGQRETIRLLLEHGASRAPWSVGALKITRRLALSRILDRCGLASLGISDVMYSVGRMRWTVQCPTPLQTMLLMRRCMTPGICCALKQIVCCHSLFPIMTRGRSVGSRP